MFNRFLTMLNAAMTISTQNKQNFYKRFSCLYCSDVWNIIQAPVEVKIQISEKEELLLTYHYCNCLVFS